MLNPITPALHPQDEPMPESVTEVLTEEEIETADEPSAESSPAADTAAVPAAPDAPVPTAPGDEILLTELAPLRTRYPRMDTQALVRTDAFRAFGESVGWDLRELNARLPEMIEASRALSAAVEPPVSRATFSAASHRRPLLTPAQARELAAWNRDYPAYRMSELDYFNALGK